MRRWSRVCVGWIWVRGAEALFALGVYLDGNVMWALTALGRVG